MHEIKLNHIKKIHVNQLIQIKFRMYDTNDNVVGGALPR